MQVSPESIAVVIPCYRVSEHVADVIRRVPPSVGRIYVVDDACPEQSAEAALGVGDPRLQVVRHQSNQGVGAAMVSGYRRALEDGCEILVKLDGDGQMDPGLLPDFLAPILEADADYTKGNRFHDLEALVQMPRARLFGNAVLSFMAKLSTGYWHLFDPTNGYTAVHADALRRVPLDKLSPRYFFETDLLFRLGTQGAVVEDVPMQARYGDETSNLRIGRILVPFLVGHARNTAKRLFYRYLLRDFSMASVELLAGSALIAFGFLHGLWHWSQGQVSGMPGAPGTVMVTALCLILGLQLLLAFLSQDMAAGARQPLQRVARRRRRWFG